MIKSFQNLLFVFGRVTQFLIMWIVILGIILASMSGVNITDFRYVNF